MSTRYKLPSLQNVNDRGNQNLKNQIALLQKKLARANETERIRLEESLAQFQEHQLQYEVTLEMEKIAALERQQRLFASAARHNFNTKTS
jgi:hypothetical protein